MGSVNILCIIYPLLSVTAASWSEPISYYKEGNITIGGLFPLHTNILREDGYSLKSQPTVPICTDYLFRGFRWMQAMLFAIEEINNSTSLLPNLRLGWKIYDTCDTTHRAVAQAMNIVNNNRHADTNDEVKVVVGDTSSTNSIAVANVLGIFDIPQISYGSTTRSLSQKNKYNSFLRTIPNDDEQATAMVDLLKFYNWTWVGAIGSDDEYGRQGLATFKQAANGICIEFEEYVTRDMDEAKILKLAERIKEYNATVFVLFMAGTPVKRLSEALNARGVVGKIWIASEAWATSRATLESGGDAMYGTLGIATRGGAMTGFRKFLESVSPARQPSNPYVAEFWERSFGCNCTKDVCPRAGEAENHITNDTAFHQQCTGKEKFSDISGNGYLDWTPSELEKSYTTYLAIYAIAHALQDILNCTDGKGHLKDGKCPDIRNLEPWQLLAYLKKVKFDSPGIDEKFGFDANGDPNATYKLVSWVPLTFPNGTIRKDVEFAHVGNFSKEKRMRWSINTTAIYWRDENGTELSDVPPSICSYPCKPGFYKVNLESDCCFECMPCPGGEYSNLTNSPTCARCEDWEMANDDRTACVPKPEDYIRWNDAYGITFICCSSIGIALTLFTAIVFFRNRRTAIVKATNVEISYMLFISLACCFLTPFIYIAKPEDWTCKARHISFILSFTFCVACILVKTLRVLTAFQATLPLNARKRSKFLGEHLQILVVVLVALVQVILCVTWLIAAPPGATVEYEADRTLLVCTPGNLPLLLATAAYLAILAVTAFVLAFRARKLPENFNEAKFITFSMLVFFIVWLSFIPAYLSTRGVMSTAVYCIGILASTFGILICIFFPKLYVILVTPENNTSERVRSATVSHAFHAASKSVIYRINSSEKKTSSTSGVSVTVDNPSPTQSIKSGAVSPSPCVARAKRNNLDPTSCRKLSADRNGNQGKNEYSIEINGKMTQSVRTPVQTTKRETNEIRSSFDVKLHVNFESERKLSDVSTDSTGNPQRSSTEDETTEGPDYIGNRFFPAKNSKQAAYRKVPQCESPTFDDDRKLRKTFSYDDSPNEDIDDKRTTAEHRKEATGFRNRLSTT